MFYCEACRVEYEWPESIGQSRGKCEMCGKIRNCHDVASKHLPIPAEPLVREARKASRSLPTNKNGRPPPPRVAPHDMDGNPMTQHQRADLLVKEIRDRRSIALGTPLKQLDDLLDEAQNPPPDGTSDGSLKPGRFNRLRAVVLAGQKYLRALADSDNDQPQPEPEDPF